MSDAERSMEAMVEALKKLNPNSPVLRYFQEPVK